MNEKEDIMNATEKIYAVIFSDYVNIHGVTDTIRFLIRSGFGRAELSEIFDLSDIDTARYLELLDEMRDKEENYTQIIQYLLKELVFAYGWDNVNYMVNSGFGYASNDIKNELKKIVNELKPIH